MIGLRFHVGGDWSTYEDMYSDIALQPLGEAVRFTDPYALNWLPAKVDGGVYIPNLVCRRVHAGALGSCPQTAEALAGNNNGHPLARGCRRHGLYAAGYRTGRGLLGSCNR